MLIETVNFIFILECDGIGFPSLFYFCFHIYFMLKSFFVMSGCGEDKVRLVFLRQLDVLMTGGHCSGVTSRSAELVIRTCGYILCECSFSAVIRRLTERAGVVA